MTRDSVFTLHLEMILPYSGKISLIDRAVDPQTGTLKLGLYFRMIKVCLRPG
jgi:membrane fusion protein (multidrug efflux system)